MLSFRTKCPVQKSPHIPYLFDANTEWATGRNVLYFAAITRSPKYRYCIFTDDDVVLHFDSFVPPQMNRLPPFRVFEQWLLEPGIDVCACYCGKSKTSPIPEVFKERKHKLERLYDTIREEASLMNRNRTFSEDLRQNLEDYDINTRTYCMNVIRRQNIKPYAHFDCQTKM